MDDGKLLLLAALRGNARDGTANRALVDYILDHLPGTGGTVRIDAKLRVRSGAVVIKREPMLHPDFIGHKLIKIECHHDRGARGSRMATRVVPLSDPRMAVIIGELLAVFRS